MAGTNSTLTSLEEKGFFTLLRVDATSAAQVDLGRISFTLVNFTFLEASGESDNEMVPLREGEDTNRVKVTDL